MARIGTGSLTFFELISGNSVLIVYADDAAGTNQSLTQGDNQFVTYFEHTGAVPTLPLTGVTFSRFIGNNGRSVFPIYAATAENNTATQTFAPSASTPFVTFFEAESSPTLPVSGQTFFEVVGETPVFERFFTTYPGILSEIGDPGDNPAAADGTNVALPAPLDSFNWRRVVSPFVIPSTAFWVAERFTIDGVASSWQIYPAQAKDSGIPFVTHAITRTTPGVPAITETQWDTDAIAAVTAFTGRSYTLSAEFGYGTVVVINYTIGTNDPVIVSGRWTKGATGADDFWTDPGEFINGIHLVGGTVSADAINTLERPASPVSLAVTDELYSTNVASGIKSRATFTWSNPSVADAPSAVLNSVSYKLSTDSTYISLGEFAVNAVINDLEPGTYDFQVAAVSGFGVSSLVSELLGQQIAGLTATPTNPANLTLNASESQALLTWDRSTELDVLSGGSVQIRYHPSTGSSVTWNTSQILVESLQGTTTSKTVPLLIGTYFIKFIDSGGRESVDPSTVINTFAPSGFNFVTNADQQPGFTGVKTNCAVFGGNTLRITTGQTTMQYDFNSIIDLGIVKSVRITPEFAASVFNPSDLICNVSDICARSTFCETQQDAEIGFEISTTEDDPTDPGAVFTAYSTLITGDVSARAFRFRLIATVGDVNTIISFTEIGMALDTVDVIVTGTVVTSAGNLVTEVYPNGGFFTGVNGTTVPRIGAQIVGGEAGDGVVITSSNALGFSIEVFNNGTRVARNVDFQAIGQ